MCFQPVPGIFLVSQAQSQLTWSCVSDSPCYEWEVKLDDLQSFFPKHYFYGSSCSSHSFYCVSQASLTLCASCDFLTSLRWSPKSLPAVPQKTEISRETQTPVIGRQCHIQMAWAISAVMNSSVAGALIFPSWKSRCTLAVMGETSETECSDLFQ